MEKNELMAITKSNGLSIIKDIEKAVKEISTENFTTEVFAAFGANDEQIYNTVYGSNGKVSDFIDEELTIVGLIISSAKAHIDINDDESPEIIKPCITFITDIGATISSISNGIWRSAKGLMQMGVGDTYNCIVKFVTVQTKKGMAHSLKVIKFIEKGDITVEV